MISAGIDTRAAIQKLQLWRKALRTRLREGFAEAAEILLDHVRAKLSGEVLRRRSGRLRASIRSDVTETTGGFAARLWSGGSVPYARIHEYGGRIAIPEIAAGNAKALAFMYGGRIVFAKRVAAHTAELRQRSYMRSSLAEFTPVFVDGIRRIAAESGQ